MDRPRSILKPSSSSSPSKSRTACVRFPSTPKLSTVHYTHCPIAYDRSPILVLPNTCAIPERNCRLYSSSSPRPKEAHPSLFNDNTLVPPPLMHDEGSSEESDGLASPPPELALSLPTSRPDVPSLSHLHSSPLSHPPIRTNSPSLNAGPSDYSLSSVPRSHQKKRDHPPATTFSVGSPTFSSTWDETSCLGGF